MFISSLLFVVVVVVEGQALIDLGDKNRAASVKWRGMSREEKNHYYQLATQLPSPSDVSLGALGWHETQRILTNVQDNVSSVQCFQVVCGACVFTREWERGGGGGGGGGEKEGGGGGGERERES